MMIALAAVVALGTVAESARAGAERWVASILPGGQRDPQQRAARGGRRSAPPSRPRLASRSRARCSSCRPSAWWRRTQEEASLAGIDPNVFQDAGALIVSGVAARRCLRRPARRRRGARPGVVRRPRGNRRREHARASGSPAASRADFVVAGHRRVHDPGTHRRTARSSSARPMRAIGSAPPPRRCGSWSRSRTSRRPVFAGAVRETAAQLAAQPLTARDLAGDLEPVAGPAARASSTCSR